jgi:polyisoprenoid-binding protein YceI
MLKLDQSNACCYVLTFKEGLLSPIAHDLRVRVTSFGIELNDAEPSVVASFDTASLRVETALRDGVENPQALSAADKDKIAAQIRDEVLHARKFPQATFRSSSAAARADGGYDIRGELSLHGVTRTIAPRTALVEGKQVLALTLHQPDFGIDPYKAMLGTLKVRADVEIRIEISTSELRGFQRA